jgi:uncharacterized protein (DUF4415 family)
MKEENITTLSFDELPEDDPTDWERFDALTDEEVEALAQSDPDNPPLTEEELNQFKRVIYVKGECVWEDTKTIGELFQEGEDFAIIPVDNDIVAWFKAQWGDYQARINTVLRNYVEAHR